jgi:hypothetical protein
LLRRYRLAACSPKVEQTGLAAALANGLVATLDVCDSSPPVNDVDQSVAIKQTE